jgi:hypothetical protein
MLGNRGNFQPACMRVEAEWWKSPCGSNDDSSTGPEFLTSENKTT